MNRFYLLSSLRKNRSKESTLSEYSKVDDTSFRHILENSNNRNALPLFTGSFSCSIARLITLLLVFCMLITAYPATALAENVQSGGNEQTSAGQNSDQEAGSSESDIQSEMESNTDNTDDDASDSELGNDSENANSEQETPSEENEGNSLSDIENNVNIGDGDTAGEGLDMDTESSEQTEGMTDQNDSDEKDPQAGEESDRSSDSASPEAGQNQDESLPASTQLENNQLEEEGDGLQQETLCEEELKLVQDGDFVSEHYGAGTAKRRSSSESLRSRISDAMAAYQTEVNISDFGYTRTNDIGTVRSVYHSCIRGNRFYISGGFSYYINGDDIITRIVIIYNSDYTDDNGQPDEDKIQKALRNYNKRANAALEYADQGRNPLEKILLTHEWIIRECDYDYDNYLANSIPSESYSAYGCLVNGTAVCNGYALCYSYLLEEMGFESYILSSDSMNHAWNLVRIDGEWMHVDVTWDDPVFSRGTTGYGWKNEDYSDEGFVNHIYFLKSDNEFENLEHSGWQIQDGDYDLPSSTASGLYDGSIFCDVRGSSINYLDGKFYFSDDGVLTVSDDLWGTNGKVVSTAAEAAYYPHAFEDNLYYTDMQDIYCYSPDSGETLLVQGEGKVVSELGIKFGELVYVLLDNDVTERHILPIGKIQPPEAVQITKYVPYEGKIKLVWEGSEEADGYVISYALPQDGKFKTLKNITNAGTLTYSHKTTEPYVQYKIRAYKTQNGEKIYSDYSETVTAGTLPGQVMNLAATELASGKTKFTWEALNEVDGYVLYESGDNGQTWKSIKTLGGTQTSYKVGLKTEDKVYRARAFRTIEGKKYFGRYSDSVKVYVKPEAPAELNVTHISDTKDKLTWTTSEGADGYILSRSSNGSSYAVLKTFADGLCDSYVATVSDGLQYLYRICAYRLVDGIKVRGNTTDAAEGQ